MNTLQLDGVDFKCEYPSRWNEINKKSLLRISLLFLTKLEKHDFLLMAFFAMLPSKRFIVVSRNVYFRSGFCRWWPFSLARAIRRGSKNMRQIDIEGFAFAKESVDFLVKELTLTKQLIPCIRLGFSKYYGPKSEIKDLTFGEYIVAEGLMRDYQESGNIEYLNKLVAVLYRKKRFGKRKADEHSEDLNARALRFGSLPLNVRYAVFLFFAGCRAYFLESFSDISSGEGSDGSGNWKDVIFQLTKGSVKNSDIDAVMDARLWNVFELFRHNKKEYEKMKRNMKKHPGNKFAEYEKSLNNDK